MRTIRGQHASIRWAYFEAAGVEGYTVILDAAGWRASGGLVPGRVDGFKLTRAPLHFVAPFKGGAWKWEIATLTTDGATFAATLGPVSIEDSNGNPRSAPRH